MDEKTIFDTVESIIETRLAPIENQLIEKEQKNDHYDIINYYFYLYQPEEIKRSWV